MLPQMPLLSTSTPPPEVATSATPTLNEQGKPVPPITGLAPPAGANFAAVFAAGTAKISGELAAEQHPPEGEDEGQSILSNGAEENESAQAETGDSAHFAKKPEAQTPFGNETNTNAAVITKPQLGGETKPITQEANVQTAPTKAAFDPWQVAVLPRDTMPPTASDAVVPPKAVDTTRVLPDPTVLPHPTVLAHPTDSTDAPIPATPPPAPDTSGFVARDMPVPPQTPNPPVENTQAQKTEGKPPEGFQSKLIAEFAPPAQPFESKLVARFPNPMPDTPEPAQVPVAGQTSTPTEPKVPTMPAQDLTGNTVTKAEGSAVGLPQPQIQNPVSFGSTNAPNIPATEPEIVQTAAVTPQTPAAQTPTLPASGPVIQAAPATPAAQIHPSPTPANTIPLQAAVPSAQPEIEKPTPNRPETPVVLPQKAAVPVAAVQPASPGIIAQPKPSEVSVDRKAPTRLIPTAVPQTPPLVAGAQVAVAQNVPLIPWQVTGAVPIEPSTVKELLAIDPVSGEPRVASTTAQTTSAMELTRRDLPAHIARQLAEAVQQQPNRPVEITLKPQELGTVRLSLLQGEAGIVVNLTAERPETLDLMRRHIDQLGQEFQAMGYTNIAFSFADSDAGTDPQSNDQAPSPSADAQEQPDAAATQIHLATGSASGVDIRL